MPQPTSSGAFELWLHLAILYKHGKGFMKRKLKQKTEDASNAVTKCQSSRNVLKHLLPPGLNLNTEIAIHKVTISVHQSFGLYVGLSVR